MSTAKTILKNITVVFTSTVVMTGLSILFTVIIARYFGAAGYGLYVYAVSLTTLFVSLSDLGLTQIAIREVAKNKKLAGEYLSNITSFKILLSIVTVAVIFILINILRGSPNDRMILYMFTAGSIFTMVMNGFRWIFQAYQEMEYESFLNVVQAILFLLVAAIVTYNHMSLYAFSISYLLINIIIFVLSLSLVVSKAGLFRLSFDLQYIRHLLLMSAPLAVMIMATSVYLNVDRIMLSAMRSDSETGLYGAAYKLMAYLKYILVIYTPVIYPALSELSVTSSEKFRKLLEKSFYFMLALTAAGAMGATIIAGPLVQFFFGNKFISADTALQIVIWTLPLVAASGILGNALISIGKQNVPMRATVTGSVVNIAANLMLIPFLGYVGASISIVLTELTVTAMIVYYSSKVLDFRISVEKSMRIVSAVLIMALITFLMRSLNIFIIVGTSTFVFFLSLIVLRLITIEEWNMIRKMFVKEPKIEL